MDDPYNTSHHLKKNSPQQPSNRRSQLRSSNLSRLSNKSADHSYFRNDMSMEENSKMNTSTHYFNQSNYFNSMLSDKGLSNMDLGENKWLRKSNSRGSIEESFERDSMLPDKLAHRINHFFENEAKEEKLQGWDDEMLTLSPGKKILEKGKEMVRKSGYGVDFSGKLISKNVVASILNGSKESKKNKTSFDRRVSENKKGIKDNSINNKKGGVININKERTQKKDKVKKTEQIIEPTGDFQGITSTKFSDLYCQDNFDCIHQDGYQYANIKREIENFEDKEMNNYNREILKHRINDNQEKKPKFNQVSPFSKSTNREFFNPMDQQINESIKDTKVDFNQGSNIKPNIMETTGTDFFENGSFLNMKDNNSLLVENEIESNSIEG